MQLPGRLRLTSVGDLLGALYRGAATGVLELTEEAFGRRHRVLLREGLVVAVESGLGPNLLELLVTGGLSAELARV